MQRQNLKSKIARLGVIITLAWTSLSGPALAQPAPDPINLSNIANRTDMVPIIVSDNTVLRATVLLPKTTEGKVPTILIFTPYVPDGFIKSYIKLVTKQLNSGYAIAIVNERGTYFSTGKYSLLAHSLSDGTNVINWITAQPWSNGKVGMFGCSAPGENQHGLIAKPPKGLSATVPIASGAGLGRIGPYNEQAGFYRGGVFQTGSWWFPWFYEKGQKIRPQFPTDISDDTLRDAAKLWTLEPNLTPSFDIGERLWTLPINNIMPSIHALPTDMDSYVNRLPNDRQWSTMSMGTDESVYRTPMLMINSWFDAAVAPNVAQYSHQMSHAAPEVRDQLYMVVAPTRHCEMLRDPAPRASGERDLGNFNLDYTDLISRWFDAHLKNNMDAMKGVPKVQVYMMGVNEWRAYDSWPPKDIRELDLFLSSNVGANSRNGDGELQSEVPHQKGEDKYVYDWRKPVPSLGGSLNIDNERRGGSFVQSEIELRNDVLVYTTRPLTEKMEISGPIKVQLYLSSDVPDTDLTVKLLDVYPDGKAYNLDDSIQRVRWRNGWKKPEFMEEGGIYRVDVGPLVTSNAFLPGHRIRIEVSSSNFPRYERNLNTGGNNFDEAEGRVANNVIHFGEEYPSKITLPVLP